MEFLKQVAEITSPKAALELLYSMVEETPNIQNAIAFATELHKEQKGEVANLISCILCLLRALWRILAEMK